MLFKLRDNRSQSSVLVSGDEGAFRYWWDVGERFPFENPPGPEDGTGKIPFISNSGVAFSDVKDIAFELLADRIIRDVSIGRDDEEDATLP